jgi:hypothetical protein
MNRETVRWSWVDGSTLSYANWFRAQPDNHDGVEDLPEILADGTWNDFAEFLGTLKRPMLPALSANGEISNPAPHPPCLPPAAARLPYLHPCPIERWSDKRPRGRASRGIDPQFTEDLASLSRETSAAGKSVDCVLGFRCGGHLSSTSSEHCRTS